MNEDLARRLVEKAYRLDQSTHRRKIIHQWEHQEVCKRYLSDGEITQEDYDRIIDAMGGAVTKI